MVTVTVVVNGVSLETTHVQEAEVRKLDPMIGTVEVEIEVEESRSLGLMVGVTKEGTTTEVVKVGAMVVMRMEVTMLGMVILRMTVEVLAGNQIVMTLKTFSKRYKYING